MDSLDIAKHYRQEVIDFVEKHSHPVKMVGFLATENAPSISYAQYTQKACAAVGIEFELRKVPRVELEAAIMLANQDSSVHGIFVYYPIFGTAQDNYLKDCVDFRKDVEGLNAYWTRKLYQNDRTAIDDTQPGKAIVPCTSLAIVKILESLGAYNLAMNPPLKGRTITVFNRSEVVGRPLAAMLSHDGGKVYSFDELGALLFDNGRFFETSISRTEALEVSDIVITGVPSKQFQKISVHELKPGVICLNFAFIPNFADDVESFSETFIDRVGPVTIAICLRNLIRLYKTFHA